MYHCVVMGNSATTEPSFAELFRSPHFERMRSRLIRMFARRGCSIPEDLADETLARATARFLDVGRTHVGNPAHFVYGVARHVYMEYSRRPHTVPYESQEKDVVESTRPADGALAREERRHACLDSCIERLDVADRHLIRQYYLHDKGAGIAWRRSLADELHVGVNALRIRACRIRQNLRGCVADCVEREPTTPQRQVRQARSEGEIER